MTLSVTGKSLFVDSHAMNETLQKMSANATAATIAKNAPEVALEQVKNAHEIRMAKMAAETAETATWAKVEAARVAARAQVKAAKAAKPTTVADAVVKVALVAAVAGVACYCANRFFKSKKSST